MGRCVQINQQVPFLSMIRTIIIFLFLLLPAGRGASPSLLEGGYVANWRYRNCRLKDRLEGESCGRLQCMTTQLAFRTHSKVLSRGHATLRRLPFESWSASRPPGPKLLLRDFFSFAADFAESSRVFGAPMSNVAFSLSPPVVVLVRGT